MSDDWHGILGDGDWWGGAEFMTDSGKWISKRRAFERAQRDGRHDGYHRGHHDRTPTQKWAKVERIIYPNCIPIEYSRKRRKGREGPVYFNQV